MYKVSINLEELARNLGKEIAAVRARVYQEVSALAASTHAFVVRYAQQHLSGWQLKYFMGEDNKNVRWARISDNIWVVEIDPSVEFIENGRDITFMGAWLLRPGDPGVKRSKAGKLYRSIPLVQARGRGGAFDAPNPTLAAIVSATLKKERISLKKLDLDAEGNPVLGVIKKIAMEAPFPQSQVPELYSKPRDTVMAGLTGLRPHGGIYKLQGLAITQSKDKGSGRVKREAVVFRTIHEGHELEGRWMYPKVDGLKSLEAAYAYAQTQWEQIVRDMQSEMTR